MTTSERAIIGREKLLEQFERARSDPEFRRWLLGEPSLPVAVSSDDWFLRRSLYELVEAPRLAVPTQESGVGLLQITNAWSRYMPPDEVSILWGAAQLTRERAWLAPRTEEQHAASATVGIGWRKKVWRP